MRWIGVGVLLVAGAMGAQVATQVSPLTAAKEGAQLSPQAAYEEAERPVDIVHRSVANWSEVEQAALAVAVGKAAAACAARDVEQYKGEDLLAYARLCSFAQMWEQVHQAAAGYLSEENRAAPEQRQKGFPNLSMAFDYEVQASLHLGNAVNAFGTAQTMVRTVVYDDLASEAADSVVRYVQLIQTDQALALLMQRQPELLAMLRAGGLAAAGEGKGTGSADGLLASARAPLTMHDLYADAIMLAAMQQFARKPEAAAASYAELEAAVPQGLSGDDAILIGTLRRQYGLLGKPLPGIAVSASLVEGSGGKASDLNRKRAGALLLFPDWCAQCVALGSRFNEVSKALKAQGMAFYGLLAQESSAAVVAKPGGKVAAKSRPGVAASAPTAADGLAGTATLVVPMGTLDVFAATDFPLLVVTDGCGVVRYMGYAPENVLVKGGLIYQVVDRVREQWGGEVARMGAGHLQTTCGVRIEGQAVE